MSTIVPEVVDRVTAIIAEIDPDKLNDREVIAYLAGISETASGMLAIKPELKAHADLVMDLANRVFHANKEAEARGYAKAVESLRFRSRQADRAFQANTAGYQDDTFRVAADYLETTRASAVTEEGTGR